MRLLLISNSTLYGGGYLDHCAGAIASLLTPPVSRVLFVPYAQFDRAGYAARRLLSVSAARGWTSLLT